MAFARMEAIYASQREDASSPPYASAVTAHVRQFSAVTATGKVKSPLTRLKVGQPLAEEEPLDTLTQRLAI